ncbi:MAG TPA: LPS assembly protein LptD [Croceibacterium sp.]|nr:LPS assembly protein LptD [Croceibacterium sp.]
MPPAAPRALPCRPFAVRRGIALAILACSWPIAAHAQDGGQAPGLETIDDLRNPRPEVPSVPKAQPAESGERAIDFEADELRYDTEADIVTASGNVVLKSRGQSVRANSVTWNRKTGSILAEGAIRLVDENGNQLFTDKLELTEKLEAGAMENLLLALAEGARLAARTGTRAEDGTIVLTDAAYSACSVETAEGCPKRPSWRITANRVTYDPKADRVRFRGARLELFGVPLLPIPGLTVSTAGEAISGILIPDLRISESNGLEISDSYYLRLADNQDLVASAYIFSDAPPMASVQYRGLFAPGAVQLTGYLTRSSRIPISQGGADEQEDWRGYLFTNGRFQLSPEWSVTGSLRLASDRTFLRRYDISREDRLRSMVEVERIDQDSYLSIAGWGTQTLRVGDPQGQVPLAVPLIDYRRRLADPVLGGTVELHANTLAITRTAGQDTQRAFAGARWDMRRVTRWGQEVTFTALVRGDVYHSDENELTTTALYRGESGWQARAVALAAVDVKWPLVGQLFGGTQVLTPHVQIVASPPIRNLAVPNEDARAIELEDSNLFALNRFPGYDRVEDSARITYGVDWQLTLPGVRIKSTIGQSYRLTNKRTLLPDGTGLSERVSDFVGRTEVRYRDWIKLTHRFRVDKDSLAVRRNEFDAAVGSDRTYIEAGYLRLNRDIDELEDLQDREELRLAGRVAFARYWSVFGSGVFNLTDRDEDPTFTSDGFEPLRTRLGVAYADDCLELGFTWRRDYASSGDAERGDTFQVYLDLKGLGGFK